MILNLIISQIPEDYKGVNLPDNENDSELKTAKLLFAGAEVCNIFLWVFGLITFLSLSQYFFVQTSLVTSGSMRPTLLVGDAFIVNRLEYIYKKPKCDDIISFKVPPEAMVIDGYEGEIYKPPHDGLSRFLDDMAGKNNKPNYVKKIVGCPGDKLLLTQEGLYRNGVLVKTYFNANSIMTYPTYTDFVNKKEFIINENGIYYAIVPKNKYFVIGDNVNYSFDSRDWGCVDRQDIKGRVKYIYFPFRRKGKIQ